MSRLLLNVFLRIHDPEMGHHLQDYYRTPFAGLLYGLVLVLFFTFEKGKTAVMHSKRIFILDLKSLEHSTIFIHLLGD